MHVMLGEKKKKQKIKWSNQYYAQAELTCRVQRQRKPYENARCTMYGMGTIVNNTLLHTGKWLRVDLKSVHHKKKTVYYVW